MFFPEGHIRVYLYGQPADMRKSYDGLYALARAGFAENPLDGHLFVFANRRGTQIKVLYFERSGWCVWSKRLEAGRFISDWSRVRSARIDCTALKLMLEGIEVKRQSKRYQRPQTHYADPMDARNPDKYGSDEMTGPVASSHVLRTVPATPHARTSVG